MNYNAVISVDDISDDSGVITEPVTLEEMKNYMRLDGWQDASSIIPEPPLTLTLAQGSTTAQDNRLIGQVILTLAREGTTYTQGTIVANLKFTFDSSTGTITFQNAGNPGGETLAITYGADNGSGIFNFTGDDTLLTELITAARQMIEEKAGLSIISHKWEAYLTNLCGRIEIPFGPNVNILSMYDCNGNAIAPTNYKLVGNMWKNLVYPKEKDLKVTYTAGYTEVPKGVKTAIMRMATYLYENRGDDPKVQAFAYDISCVYSRQTMIA